MTSIEGVLAGVDPTDGFAKVSTARGFADGPGGLLWRSILGEVYREGQ